MVILDGPLGFLFGIGFFALFVYAIACAIMTVRHSTKPGPALFILPLPASVLTERGKTWRRRYFLALGLAFSLYLLAALTLGVEP